MNRRHFLTSMTWAATLVLVPKRLLSAVGNLSRHLTASPSPIAPWWREEDFVFEGVPGTRYFWPQDRYICFDKDIHHTVRVRTRRGWDVVVEGESVMPPTFALNDPHLNSTIEQQLRNAKTRWGGFDLHEDCRRVDAKMYFTVVFVDGFGQQVVSILVDSEKLHPTMLPAFDLRCSSAFVAQPSAQPSAQP